MAAIQEVKPTNVKNNSQTVKIQSANLERATKRGERFDSTLDERERTYQARKPEPRFSEYR